MTQDLLFLLIGLALGAAGTSVWFLIARQRGIADQARLGAELDAARRMAEDQRQVVAETQARLRESFAALSQDALRDNRADFVQRAEALLQPVRDTLDKVQLQVAAADRDRAGSYQAVTS